YFVNDNWSLHSNSYVGPQLGHNTLTLTVTGIPINLPGAPVLGNQLMHDLYAKGQLSERVELIAGFDVGVWQYELDLGALSNGRIWFAPSLVAAYKTGEKSRITLRLEHFNDAEGALVNIPAPGDITPGGLFRPSVSPIHITGASVNYDYNLSAFAKWRIEARGLYSQNSIFPKTYGSNAPNANTLVFFTTSLSVRLFK
ncbi:MAG: outer membrane beta-barrel protein, partial [Flavobacteriales bacterium]